MIEIKKIFITMESSKRPYYFIRLDRYDPVDMVYIGEEYQFDGINPEKDMAIYKHRRGVLVPNERLYEYNQIEDPRR